MKIYARNGGGSVTGFTRSGFNLTSGDLKDVAVGATALAATAVAVNKIADAGKSVSKSLTGNDALHTVAGVALIGMVGYGCYKIYGKNGNSVIRGVSRSGVSLR